MERPKLPDDKARVKVLNLIQW